MGSILTNPFDAHALMFCAIPWRQSLASISRTIKTVCSVLCPKKRQPISMSSFDNMGWNTRK